MKSPLVLGIESSCDDTACAVVDGDGRVLSSVVSRQLAAHRPYGGVVPEVASREHLRNWIPVSERALEQAGITLADVDAVAATRGPGLVGSLLVGLSIGRALAYGLGKRFHAVHHLEGHVFSPFLVLEGEPARHPPETFTALVVSGGHTTLAAVDGERIRALVETRDDAIGEVFDKVGKRLGLPYPQGPLVDRLAEEGDAGAFRFAVPKIKDEPFFSYSGLKSAVLREVDRLERGGEDLRGDPEDDRTVPQVTRDLLASFRKAAVAQVLHRLELLRTRAGVGVVAVSGGVAANRLLRRELESWSAERGVDLRLVPLAYSGDNAAMIAWAGVLRDRSGVFADPREPVAAESRIPFPRD